MTRTSLVLAAALVALSACKKQAPAEVAAVSAKPVAPVAEADHDHANEVAALKENFAKVFFQFDSAELQPASRQALKANADILGAHPKLRVEVEGHADERGTSDYNLALGQKRAESVRATLMEMGVSPRQIRTVSFGEEKPAVEGSGESIWSQNRRAEFRVIERQGAIADSAE